MKCFLLRRLSTPRAPHLHSFLDINSVGCPSVSSDSHESLSGLRRLTYVQFPSPRGSVPENADWSATGTYLRVSLSKLALPLRIRPATYSGEAAAVPALRRHSYIHKCGGNDDRHWPIFQFCSGRSKKIRAGCTDPSHAAAKACAALQAVQSRLHDNCSSLLPARTIGSNCSILFSGTPPLPCLLRAAPVLCSWLNSTGGRALSTAGATGPIGESPSRVFHHTACVSFCPAQSSASTTATLKALLISRGRVELASSFPCGSKDRLKIFTHAPLVPHLPVARSGPFSAHPPAQPLPADRPSSTASYGRLHPSSVEASWSCPISSTCFAYPAWLRREAFPAVSIFGVSLCVSDLLQPQLSVSFSLRVCPSRTSRLLLNVAAAATADTRDNCCRGACRRHPHTNYTSGHDSFQPGETSNDGSISHHKFFMWAFRQLLPLLPPQFIELEATGIQQQYSPRCLPTAVAAALLPSRPEQLQQQQELHHMLPHHRRVLLQQQQLLQQRDHPYALLQQRSGSQQLYQQREATQSRGQDGGVENGTVPRVEQSAIMAQCLIKARAFARSWRRHREQTVDTSTTLLVAAWASIPYVGFGFMDNCLMLLCGEMIDTHIGAALGVSTLAAAGLGNLLSCASGVVTGGCVERLAARVTLLPKVHLSSGQVNAKAVSRARTAGALVGICCGCILGLFPLLFFGITRKASPFPQGSSKDDGMNPD